MGITVPASPNAPEQDALTCICLRDHFVLPDFWISDLQLWF